MPRLVVFIFLLSLGRLGAQETPVSPAEREAAAAVQPPAIPLSSGPALPAVSPMAPPLPGQLKADPAPALSPLPAFPPAAVPSGPIPPQPPTAVARVPSSPLRTGPAKTGSSTSTSGQFIVHGDDLTLRSAFSTKCEEISEELRLLLKDKKPWVLPIVVLLTTGDTAKKADKPISTVISQLTHGGFHLQVNVSMRPGLRPTDVRKELIRALLAERILRDQKEIATKRSLLLPDWLFLGTLEALDYRQRARPSALFAAIFKSGKIYSIEEIIEASASDIDDGLSKIIYQTSCCALVMALLDQPEAGLRVGKFLSALASDPRPERDLLNQWFPNFATTDTSLNKWWALQLATLASPSMAEPLSPTDTFKALDDALTLRFQAKPSDLPQSSRRVMAAVKPTPAPAPAPLPESTPAPRERTVAKRSPTPAPSADAPPAPEIPEVEPLAEEKRGMFSRLNPFSRRSTSDEDIEAAILEAAKAENSGAPDPVSTMPPESAPEEAPAVAESAPAKPNRAPMKIRPLFGNSDSPPPAPAPENPEPSAEPAPAMAAETPPEPIEDKPKEPSRRGGFLGFGRSKEAPADAPEPEAEKPATPEAKPVVEKPKPAVEKPAPTLAPAPAKPSEKPTAPKKEETEPVAPPTENKKPSNLNPLRWFRGGKKDDAAKEAPVEEPKDKKAEATPAREPAPNQPTVQRRFEAGHTDLFAQALFTGQPLRALILQQVAATETAAAAEAAEEPVKEKKRFLGLFGKKTPQEEPAEPAPAPPSEKKPAEAKPKEKPKPTEKPKAPEPEEPKPEAPKPEKKVEPKPSVESPAMETPPAESPEEPEAKREGSRLGRLFGFGKKDETPKEDMPPEPATPETPTPPVSLAPATAALPTPAPTPSKPKTRSKSGEPTSEKTIAAAVPIEDYAALLKQKDMRQVLDRNINSLALLQNRAAVLFRPIISDYSAALVDLRDGKTKDMDARLRALRVRADKALEQSKAVRDFLDLHEANESPALSGLFDDYLKLPETIQNELPPRTDPISKYLDALDKEFSQD